MRSYRPWAVTLATLIGCAAPADSSPDLGGAPDQGLVTPAEMHVPSDADRTAILAPLQTFFDGLAQADGDLIRSVVHPDIVMRSTRTNASGESRLSVSTADDLAGRLQPDAPPLIERMWDPVVLVSGAMATIWTPYDFYRGDEFSHCGVDVATLMNADGDWTIVSLNWTVQQPPDCDMHPEGPPARG